MSRELIRRYPKILQYSSIWMEDITHVTRQGSKPFTLSNTNKLIRGYEGCLGLKTGSTDAAKYCVSAVAERNGMTLIAVVMGAPDHKVRFQDASAMLDYGFGSCQLYVDENQEPLEPAPVDGSTVKTVPLEYEEEFRFLEREGRDLSAVKKTIEVKDSVKAPVRKGENAGRGRLYAGRRRTGKRSHCLWGRRGKSGVRGLPEEGLGYIPRAGRRTQTERRIMR